MRLICSILFLLVISSCVEDDHQLSSTYGPAIPTDRPYHYGVDSDDIATLGRVLFYDKALSGPSSTSCGSCHKQSAGFADNKSFSTGIYNQLTIRNSLPIMNLIPISPDSVVGHPDPQYGSATSGRIGLLFWDGRETELAQMVLQPITNSIEMGNDIPVSRIRNTDYYGPLFFRAFGNYDVTNERVSRALSAFVLSIKASNSRFDRYNDAIKNNKPTDNILSPLEIKGMQLFQGTYNCNNCHQVEQAMRITPRFANIGLPYYTDKGLANITGSDADIGKFRVPSLRNVEFTAPYMHDGSLPTLETVIQHYSDGIVDHPNLHEDLRDETGHARQMNITPDDVTALVAFLHSLSDNSSLKDPKFSDPFPPK